MFQSIWYKLQSWNSVISEALEMVLDERSVSIDSWIFEVFTELLKHESKGKLSIEQFKESIAISFNYIQKLIENDMTIKNVEEFIFKTNVVFKEIKKMPITGEV